MPELWIYLGQKDFNIDDEAIKLYFGWNFKKEKKLRGKPIRFDLKIGCFIDPMVIARFLKNIVWPITKQM